MGAVADAFSAAFADNNAVGQPIDIQKPACRALGVTTEQAIAAETSRAQSAEGSLAAALSSETTARTTGIGNETTARLALADTMASALSGETTRAQGVESSLSEGVSNLANRISSEVSRATTAEQANASALVQEAQRRADADGANASALAQETQRATAAEAECRNGVGALGERMAAALASETNRATAAEASCRTDLSALAGTVTAARNFSTFRPGDAASLFTAALGGQSPSDAILGASAMSSRGATWMLQPGATLALRQATWLEPQAFFAVRFVLARAVDPDPRAPAAVLGVAWLDAAFNVIATVPMRFYRSLRVSDGLQLVTARVPSLAPDPCDLVPPPGAVYVRPFVRDLSQDGVLAVSSITLSDVTDAGVYAPDVSDLAARVVALETRLAQFGG